MCSQTFAGGPSPLWPYAANVIAGEGWRCLRFTPAEVADGTGLAVLEEAWGALVGTGASDGGEVGRPRSSRGDGSSAGIPHSPL